MQVRIFVHINCACEGIHVAIFAFICICICACVRVYIPPTNLPLPFLPLRAQSVVLSFLAPRETGGWGAKGGRRLVVFIDDLHLAAHDDYQARPVHELVREAMQRKSW